MSDPIINWLDTEHAIQEYLQRTSQEAAEHLNIAVQNVKEARKRFDIPVDTESSWLV